MSLQFSPISQAVEASHGGNFSVFRLDLERLGGFIAPIMGFDHYRMSGPTFAPHPHAGFSAVSYVFENSAGALRNRDSLGHDLTVQPGELLWTQAGRGVIHDEFPASNGAAVHGLQLFVNLSSKNKHLAPQVFHADADAIPVSEEAAGNRIRILTGQRGELRSPITPTEPFDFFDARLNGSWVYPVKSHQNVMVYVLSGAVTISIGDGERSLGEHEAVGIRADVSAGDLRIEPKDSAHLLLLSGQDSREPVAVGGPFIMNTHDELADAYERYRIGQMGRLAPA